MLANDPPDDGPGRDAVLVDPWLHNELIWTGGGSFVFMPAPGFSGVCTFSRLPTDGPLNGPQTPVTIHVAAP